jgi:hypothetical protein
VIEYKKIIGAGDRPVYVVYAPCVVCGTRSEGIVANSRKGDDVSKRIAKQWAEQLRCGQYKLYCNTCLKKKFKA